MKPLGRTVLALSLAGLSAALYAPPALAGIGSSPRGTVAIVAVLIGL
jgi:hypothetical protein